jgi:hypothetical protein
VARISRSHCIGGLLLAATLVMAIGCGDGPTNPAAPTGTPGPLGDDRAASITPEPLAARATVQPKVSLCHRTEGTQAFVMLSVPASAVDAHRAHGDGRVGDAVPGRPGMTFGPGCSVVAPSAVPVPLAPLAGAVLDNGCYDRTNAMTWSFDWSDVPGATAYHLFVQHATAPIPLVDDATIATSSFEYTSSGAYTLNLDGWQWKVRAQVGGTFGDWSPVTTFAVEPIDTDCAPETITFENLSVNGAAVSSYTESGFTLISTAGDWKAVTTYGNPAPSLQFETPAGSSASAQVRITAGGSAFRFVSVDVYSSLTAIPYQFRGVKDAVTVFTVTATEPQTFGSFARVPNPHAADVIDELTITLTNTTPACCGNPMGLDNIAVSR